MKKGILFLLAVALCATLSACQTGGQKVALVDMGRVFQEAAPAQAGQQYLADLNMKLQTQFAEIQQKMGDKEPSPEEMAQIQQSVASLRANLESAQKRVMDRFDAKMTEVMDKYRADNGYTVMMLKETIVSFDKSIDVTEAIIAEMNKITLNFDADVAKPAAALPVFNKADAAAEKTAETSGEAGAK